MVDYPTNGGSVPGGTPSAQIDPNEMAANAREYAADAAESFNELVARGKEVVVRYPLLTVAGAVAAGYLFAKFVARR
jgi:hypothetical protein